MKTKAVAASGARVPAPKGAPESSHASESSDEPANGSVAMDEARQDATSSSPQRQDSTAQPLGNKKGPAVSRQTFSSDVIGLTTPAAKGEMEEEAASSGGMAPALPPTPSAGSRQEVLEAKKPFSGERPEGGQEPLPPTWLHRRWGRRARRMKALRGTETKTIGCSTEFHCMF
ncbi:hypothetical protein TcYC6_0001840 [Trypanosoma cruzi]|nr:hypothetical protein TcYC6_0001840 [Trypanosoma cruzi]